MNARATSAGRGASALLVALAWLGMSLGPVAIAHATPRARRAPEAFAYVTSVSVPITLHLATTARGAVVSPARVGAWIVHTNEVLAPHGVQLRVVGVRMMPPGTQDASRLGQRRRLSWQTEADGTLHVFVVERLDRQRAPGRARVRGLWWKPGMFARAASEQLVLVSRFAAPETLAHEIGHVLGLGHRLSSDNLMCSCDRAASAGLDARQGAKLRAAARRMRG